jgi:IS5 family transposase
VPISCAGKKLRIVDSHIYEWVLQDLTRNVIHTGAGAQGMSAEQVVRAAIIKQMEDYSYEELAFHLLDSVCYRGFCRIGIADKGFQKSALCNNIKALSAETWEAINRILVAHGQKQDIEKGKEVRIDSTVVSSNIHHPTDSGLLWDCVRVLTRMLGRINEQFDEIKIAKSKEARRKQYEDLLKVTHDTIKYAHNAISLLDGHPFENLSVVATAHAMAENLNEVIQLAYRVIDQTTRRVIHGESVPSCEKIVSIFEPHTDIIVKDRRDTFYGHKVCLTGGGSNLITDCLILDGNPADTELSDQMLDRHKEIYGHYPLKVALDGGFASKANLTSAKGRGIKDVCFAKKRGLEEEEMCRSTWVYKRLRRFRAGIESGISWLKRCFGFGRCMWKSLPSFHSYVWASIVSANLLTLARKEFSIT